MLWWSYCNYMSNSMEMSVAFPLLLCGVIMDPVILIYINVWGWDNSVEAQSLIISDCFLYFKKGIRTFLNYKDTTHYDRQLSGCKSELLKHSLLITHLHMVANEASEVVEPLTKHT